MSEKYAANQRQALVNRYLSGESVSSISATTGIPRSTLYTWVKTSQEQQSKSKPIIDKRYVQTLEKKVQRLEGLIEIIQRADCSLQAPMKERLYAIENLYGQYNVHMLCDALDVPRGTFYNHIKRNKRDATCYAKRREELRIKIQQVYDDSNQIFGAAKIAAVLKRDGYKISVEMVRELMRDMGLISIRQDAKNLYDKERRKHKNYLNQNFDVDKPNQVWVSDVTYFQYDGKPYYICAIIDLYARMVIAHKIGLANSTQLVKGTFKIAYVQRQPAPGLIFHTDRGSNYRSHAMAKYLQECQVTQSFSKPHVPYDNSVMESFFASLKKEELYRTKYRSERAFRTAVDNYMEFYNTKRPHARNKYKTPAEYEAEYSCNHEG